MSLSHRLYPCLAAPILGLIVAGCATTSTTTVSEKDVHQFKPAPVASVGAKELAPMATGPVTELLRQADAAFQAAAAAQAAGNKEQARTYYAQMLDLVEKAGMDPDMFYSVRQEFAQYLKDDKGLYDRYYSRHGGKPETMSAGGAVKRPYGQIQVPFPLPAPVIEEIERIQYSYPKSFQAALDRSAKYVPQLKAELEGAGLPPELAYVAMIESHYTPKIDSRAGAGGMWQFMPATARRFNLRQDSYVDERYNWNSSTRAAIDYLKKLNDHFGGEWPLAITAYNMGEGGMARAVEAGGGETDLWKLISTPPAMNRMHEESRRYYAKYLAYWIVASNPERYGFTPSRATPDQVARVRVDGCYALDDLDQALKLSPGTLSKLNPELIRELTPPSGGYDVCVPATCKEMVVAALKDVPTANIVTASHKVRRGENLSQIAKRYGTTEDEITKLNKLRSTQSLRVGQALKLPPNAKPAVGGDDTPPVGKSTELAMAKVDTKETAIPPAKAGQAGTYTVRRGDTLFEIARKQGVGVKDLQGWNKLTDKSKLHVGQHLYVRTPARDAKPEEREVLAKETSKGSSEGKGGAKTHEVKPGEYPAKIAKVYGVPVEDLLAWNKLSKDAQIQVGQKLLVHVTKAEGVPSGLENKQTYTVAKGDALSKIAAKNNVSTKDLMAWNKLASASDLKAGQKLVIYNGEKTAASEDPAEDAPETKDEPKLAETTHVVAKGEVPGAIAEKYGVKLSELLAWNGMTKSSTLQIGQKLVVKGGKTSSGKEQLAKADSASSEKEQPKADAPEEATTHVVAAGHNPWSIAKRYGVDVKDLYRWNNWSEGHVLKVGDKVVVKK